MSLGLIHTQNDSLLKHFSTKKDPVSRIEDNNPLFCVREGLTGNLEPIYHVSTIFLLDQVFLTNNFHLLGESRERFIRTFFTQAGSVTDKLNRSPNTDCYEDLDDALMALDKFLGNYYGDHRDQYTK